MHLDKNKLMEVATPMSDESRSKMHQRKKDRYWKAASAAISAKVRRQLKVSGTTRVKLAESLEVTPANITRYLSGETNFELKTLVELERALDIEIINRSVIPEEDKRPVIIEVRYDYPLNDEWQSSEIGVGRNKNKYPIYG